jgi:hypothetical protein
MVWDVALAVRWSIETLDIRLSTRLITRQMFVSDRWWLAVLVRRV